MKDGGLLLRNVHQESWLEFVSPNIGGGWRSTTFHRLEPVGHAEFASFREAVLSLSGKAGPWGPPNGSPGSWVVLGEADRF